MSGNRSGAHSRRRGAVSESNFIWMYWGTPTNCAPPSWIRQRASTAMASADTTSLRSTCSAADTSPQAVSKSGMCACPSRPATLTVRNPRTSNTCMRQSTECVTGQDLGQNAGGPPRHQPRVFPATLNGSVRRCAADGRLVVTACREWLPTVGDNALKRHSRRSHRRRMQLLKRSPRHPRDAITAFGGRKTHASATVHGTVVSIRPGGRAMAWGCYRSARTTRGPDAVLYHDLRAGARGRLRVAHRHHRARAVPVRSASAARGVHHRVSLDSRIRGSLLDRCSARLDASLTRSSATGGARAVHPAT
jgi:hypothetical protein